MKNSGDQVTEFYLYGEDGLRIVGEIENVGPGLTRDLVVRAEPGKYVTACKPGMKGKGIREDFTVTRLRQGHQASRASTRRTSTPRPRSTPPTSRTSRRSWSTRPRRSSTPTRPATTTKAKELFPEARQHWERIETVAESFGDLDPKMDLREADLEQGQEWTGWHRIEKDLWPPASGYQAMTHAAAGEVRRRPAGQHQGPRQAGAEPEVHRRPDRQRLQGPARRGRQRQDHRRGGHLVAHRPVGLPGQRRRRPRGLRGTEAAARGQGPRALQADRDRASPTCRPSWTSTRTATASSSTTRSPRSSASSSPTRPTRWPSRSPR